MGVISIPAIAVVAPLLALSGYIGYRRSWTRELLTGAILVAGIAAFDRVVALLLQVAVEVTRAVAVLLARLGLRSLGIDSALAHAPKGAYVAVCSVAFLVLAYRLGGTVQPAAARRLDQLAGVTLGAVNLLLLLAFVSARVDSVRPARGGAHAGLRIQLPALPAPDALSRWTAYAAVLVLVLAVGWGASNVYRIRG